jgi:hypothetical protein
MRYLLYVAYITEVTNWYKILFIRKLQGNKYLSGPMSEFDNNIEVVLT